MTRTDRGPGTAAQRRRVRLAARNARAGVDRRTSTNNDDQHEQSTTWEERA